MRPNQHGRTVPSHNICCAVLVKREEESVCEREGEEARDRYIAKKNEK